MTVQVHTVTKQCEHCGQDNQCEIAENVIAGTITACKKCGKHIFIPSPNMCFKTKEEQDGFLNEVEEHVINPLLTGINPSPSKPKTALKNIFKMIEACFRACTFK